MSFIKPKQEEKIDLYKFMPDNFTMGTEAYYKRKFGNKFSEELYKYFEVKARPEYDEQDEKKLIEQINEYRNNYEKQLLNELKDRENENKETQETEIDLTQLLICE